MANSSGVLSRRAGRRPERRRLVLCLTRLALAVFALCLPILGQASELEVVTWDDLTPVAQTAPGPESPESPARPAPVPHIPGQADALPSASSFDNPFDPLNTGPVVVEDWAPPAFAVTQALLDTHIVLDGYVLPLRWEGDRVVEFLLVPWVGACIHMPAPPPNQIVHVGYPAGLSIKEEFEAVRLAGTLRHAPAEHELFLVDGQRPVSAAYALSGARTAGLLGEVVAASVRDLPVLARAQLWANALFIDSMSALGGAPSAGALFSALLLAFAYGVFHTFGPGHGKSVVVSYFVGTEGSLWRGLTMGVRIAIVHVLSAVVVVFALDLAVRQTTGAAPSDYRAIRLASYALIMLIGAAMLWQAVRGALAQRRGGGAAARPSDGACHHAAHAHDAEAHGSEAHGGCSACAAATNSKGGGWIAASVGLVPCTGALLVMLFGLANDLVGPAILMVMAISAGMAVAMAAIGVLAIWGRNLAKRRLARQGAPARSFEQGARLVGSTCVLAIGTLLFVITLSNPPSAQRGIENSALGATAQTDFDG